MKIIWYHTMGLSSSLLKITFIEIQFTCNKTYSVCSVLTNIYNHATQLQKPKNNIKYPHDYLQSISMPTASSRQPLICFLSPQIVLSSLELRINGILQHVLVGVWGLSLSIMFFEGYNCCTHQQFVLSSVE